MAAAASTHPAPLMPTVTVDAPAIAAQYDELLRENELLRAAIAESEPRAATRRGFSLRDAFVELFKRQGPAEREPSPLQRFVTDSFHGTTLVRLGATAALSTEPPSDAVLTGRAQALASIRARGDAQSATTRERAERFVALHAAAHSPNVIDELPRVWYTLSPAERKALAPAILRDIFADDETVRGPTHVAVQRAGQLFAELHEHAGAPPITPAAPSILPRADFSTKMTAFEGALAQSLGHATLYEAARAFQVDHRLSHTWGLYTTHTHIVESDEEIVWFNTRYGDPVAANRGCKPDAIADALGIALLTEASPLERAGFAAIARRFLTVVDAADFASHRTRAALAPIIACEGIDAPTRSRATKLCAIEALSRRADYHSQRLRADYAESVRAD